MFQKRTNQNRLRTAISMSVLIFHNSARTIRNAHRFAILAIITNVLTILMMVAVFLMLFQVLGLRRALIRGDMLLFMLSGIFLYMSHVRTVSSIAGAEGSAASIMQHAPMNPFISIASGALSSLYIQTLSLLLVLSIYYLTVTHYTIYDPVRAFTCFLIAWFCGIGVGLIFMSIKPWLPSLTPLLVMFYQRANMIASGKMFVANSLNEKMRNIFDWNPLFHLIDQTRGAVFINYNPLFTNLEYPIYLGIALFAIGLIAEFYTSRRESLSWSARS